MIIWCLLLRRTRKCGRLYQRRGWNFSMNLKILPKRSSNEIPFKLPWYQTFYVFKSSGFVPPSSFFPRPNRCQFFIPNSSAPSHSREKPSDFRESVKVPGFLRFSTLRVEQRLSLYPEISSRGLFPWESLVARRVRNWTKMVSCLRQRWLVARGINTLSKRVGQVGWTV